MENEKVKTLNDLDSYKWFIFYFDENSINLQFDCNKIEESLKAQRDKIKQFCIDTLTGIEHYADGFLFDTMLIYSLLLKLEDCCSHTKNIPFLILILLK